MGCWNGTCGITQIAIRAGEDAVGFLMVRNYSDKWSANGHCYPTTYWCPVSLHIEGTYNDYGTFEDVDESDWNYRVAVKYIRDNVIELELGENEYHDVPVKADDLGWEKLAEAMHEDRIGLKTEGFWKQHYPNVTELQVGFMMVHKKVFDAIVKEGIKGWFGSITMDSLMKDGKEIVAYFRENNRKREAAVTEDDKVIADLLAQVSLDTICHNDRDNHLRQLTISGEGADFNTGKEYMLYLSNKVAEGATDEELETIIKKMSEFYIFQCAMSMMRKTWMPQSGSGSQTDELNLHVVTNNAVYDIITERRAERAEQEAEYAEIEAEMAAERAAEADAKNE